MLARVTMVLALVRVVVRVGEVVQLAPISRSDGRQGFYFTGDLGLCSGIGSCFGVCLSPRPRSEGQRYQEEQTGGE